MPDLDEPATATQVKIKEAKKVSHHRDPTRETVETIVFVAVLVLLLKLFVTEAFVIPTGSMATTLYGIHKMILCPECGYEFPVNSHDEEEGNQNGRKMPLYGYNCPNCRYQGPVEALKPQPPSRSGDRVLVLKPIYHIREPERGDVVVFKFPKEPQVKQTAQNYIKRMEGCGGETIAIFRGDLFVTRNLTYPADQFPRPDNPLELWEKEYMYPNNKRALDFFELSKAHRFPQGPHGPFSGEFEIARKGEKQLLADRRIVWHNDQQPAFLRGKVPPRWYPLAEGRDSWLADDGAQPKTFGHKGNDLHWIRYRHLAMSWKTAPPTLADSKPPTSINELVAQKPTTIDNFLGYNAGIDYDPTTGRIQTRENLNDKKWVGDLILECEAKVETGAEVVLELSKGVNRFKATFANGKVSLAMTGSGNEGFKSPSRPCSVTTGTYRLRFANVDCKLWVWVNGSVIDFGDEGMYQPVEADGAANPEGWVEANDVDAPASIGAKGEVTVAHINLDRDIYYTNTTDSPVDVYYVQPGCYMCMGDNSAQSSDSRTWGLVPNRLMLGKAVFVFWPYDRVGFIK